jgi:hypothetical protein
MNSINSMQLVKITMEIVEKLENKASGEKKLIVISVLEDFINLYENSLAIEMKVLMDNHFISHIIEAFVFASKEKININVKNCNKCCFIC